MMAVYDHMEQSYSLLGATAVEDKLQDGLRDTLVNNNSTSTHLVTGSWGWSGKLSSH